MDKPRVTVMIPVYNQANFIKQAINSVLMQDYPNVDIVISDDASSDGTRSIIEQYSDKRIKHYRNEKNIGRVANYKKLLYEYATGDYVLNLDADDYLNSSDVISKLIGQIDFYHKKECANIVMVMALAKTIYDNAEITYKRKDETCINGYYVFLNWKNTPFFHAATLYSRNVALKIGFYKYNILNTDNESFLRLCLSGNVVLSNINAAIWRLHSNNASNSTDIDELFKNLEFIRSPYRYALGLGFEKKQLINWKRAMLDDRYNKMLSKILIKKDKRLFMAFLRRLRTEDKKRIKIIFYPKNIIKIVSFYIPFLFEIFRSVKWFFKNNSKPPKV